MFETAMLSYGPPGKRVWATAMGFTGQALVIGCALLAPLISPHQLGRAFLVTTLVTPGAPPPPPPPGPRIVPRTSRTVATQFREHVLLAPIHIPAVPTILIDPPETSAQSGPGAPGGIPGGISTTVPEGIVGSILTEGARIAQAVQTPEVVHGFP